MTTPLGAFQRSRLQTAVQRLADSRPEGFPVGTGRRAGHAGAGRGDVRKPAMIALGVILVGLTAMAAVAFQSSGYHDRAQWGRSDLYRIGRAIRNLAYDGTLTPAEWDHIHDMGGLAPLLAPQPERDGLDLLDPWGQQWLLEKQEEGENIVVVIRSSHVIPRKWYQWRRNVLAIRVTISRSDGHVREVKDLWDGE